MGFYAKYLLPRLITAACATKPMDRQRRKVVPRARGRVLEIGMGAGHNLPHYDAEAVTTVVGVDPCHTSWTLAEERVANADFDVEFVCGSAEAVPLEDASFDCAVITFSLCTIPDPHAALREIKRLLKPEGEVIFCEHGIAPDDSLQRWQHRINPVWKRIAGGCNLNRDIPAIFEAEGFVVEELETMYLPNTPKFAAYNFWGLARPKVV